MYKILFNENLGEYDFNQQDDLNHEIPKEVIQLFKFAQTKKIFDVIKEDDQLYKQLTIAVEYFFTNKPGRQIYLENQDIISAAAQLTNVVARALRETYLILEPKLGALDIGVNRHTFKLENKKNFVRIQKNTNSNEA